MNKKREIYEISGLRADISGRKVSADGKKISMTPKEYSLLFYLIKNADIALSRNNILNSVWGYDFYGDSRTVDTHIKTVRKKLGEYGKYVVTVRGVGYMFDTEE